MGPALLSTKGIESKRTKEASTGPFGQCFGQRPHHRSGVDLLERVINISKHYHRARSDRGADSSTPFRPSPSLVVWPALGCARARGHRPFGPWPSHCALLLLPLVSVCMFCRNDGGVEQSRGRYKNAPVFSPLFCALLLCGSYTFLPPRLLPHS